MQIHLTKLAYSSANVKQPVSPDNRAGLIFENTERPAPVEVRPLDIGEVHIGGFGVGLEAGQPSDGEQTREEELIDSFTVGG